MFIELNFTDVKLMIITTGLEKKNVFINNIKLKN